MSTQRERDSISWLEQWDYYYDRSIPAIRIRLWPFDFTAWAFHVGIGHAWTEAPFEGWLAWSVEWGSRRFGYVPIRQVVGGPVKYLADGTKTSARGYWLWPWEGL
jgi:hypothetical protein